MSSSDLKAAVEALYRGADEARRNEANQWLMSFSKTAEAWEGARALLSDPAEDVQYFGANMFFVKVRSEWHGMPEEAKASVYSGLQQLVMQLARHEGGGWHRLSAAGKRLCLTLAAAAVRSGSTADNFVREALSMCTATGAPVAVELLTALPQEVLDHEAQAQAGVAERISGEARPEMRALLPQVLAALQATLLQAGGQENAECATACLKATGQWMQLRAGGSLLLLVESFPQLLSASFDALAAQDAQLNAAAADALVELLSGHNSQLALGSEAAAAATRLVSERLQQLATTLRVSEALKAGEEVEERVYHACRVFCAFAERAVDLVAATEGALLPVAQLQLLCLGGELRVAELTTDFWTSLQDTPLAQRHAQLREPLYRELQQRVLALCTLPADFATNWDEYGGAIEEEDFTRFREQGAAEVLSQCLQLLHTEFVDGLRQTMGDGSQWQRLEVVLFAVRALHIDVKGTLQQEADGGGGLPPARQQAHKHAVEQLLRDLCAPIASENAIFRAPPAGSAAPPLVLSAARLVGTFGKWINAQGEAEQLMYGCVRFVLGALQVSDAAEAAAEAFRALCVHGRRQLARAETIHGMLQACAPSLRAEELPAELRVALVEGLARLVAQLSKPEEAAQALQALVEAPCTALGALLHQAPPPPPPPPPPGAPPQPLVPPEMGAAVATQLQLIAAAIRYCDQFRPERHPVLPVLQHCWPLLQAVGARFALPVVVQALCELYSRAMTSLKQLLRPLLPQLLGQIHAVFGSTPVIGCLTCVSQAIETYAAEDDAEENEVANALSHVTGGLVESICAFIRGAPDPEAQPELLTAFFEMCHRTLVCNPALLLNLAALPTLFDAAIACVCHQEFQHTRAALTFLCLFMSGTQDAGPHREAAAHCMHARGADLMRQCLVGLSGTSPPNQLRNLIETMRVLVEACPGAVQNWLLAIVQAPGFHCGAVDPHGGTMATFAQLLARQASLSTGDFQCVVYDFSQICRGKLAAESLSKYAS